MGMAGNDGLAGFSPGGSLVMWTKLGIYEAPPVCLACARTQGHSAEQDSRGPCPGPGTAPAGGVALSSPLPSLSQSHLAVTDYNTL